MRTEHLCRLQLRAEVPNASKWAMGISSTWDPQGAARHVMSAQGAASKLQVCVRPRSCGKSMRRAASAARGLYLVFHRIGSREVQMFDRGDVFQGDDLLKHKNRRRVFKRTSIRGNRPPLAVEKGL